MYRARVHVAVVLHILLPVCPSPRDLDAVLHQLRHGLSRTDDALQDVAHLRHARCLDVVELVARQHRAQHLRQYISADGKSCAVREVLLADRLHKLFRVDVAVAVAILLALVRQHRVQERDRAQHQVSDDNPHERASGFFVRFALRLFVRAILLLPLCLAHRLSQLVVFLLRHRLEQRERSNHLVVAPHDVATVHHVVHRLAAADCLLELLCHLLIELARSFLDVLLRSHRQVRLLAFHLVLRPAPQCLDGRAVHPCDASAAEHEVERSALLQLSGIVFQLRRLRRRIPQLSVPQLAGIGVDELVIHPLCLRNVHRHIFPSEVCRRQRIRCKLFEHNGWIEPEHRADVSAQRLVHQRFVLSLLSVLKLHQQLVDEVHIVLAPLVRHRVAHTVVCLAPVHQRVPVTNRDCHADEPCRAVHASLEGVERADVVARIAGVLALLQVPDALRRHVEDAALALDVVVVGVDRRVVLSHRLVVAVQQV